MSYASNDEMWRNLLTGAAGELLVSAASTERAKLHTARLESRRLDLKGREEPVDVYVLGAATAAAAAA